MQFLVVRRFSGVNHFYPEKEWRTSLLEKMVTWSRRICFSSSVFGSSKDSHWTVPCTGKKLHFQKCFRYGCCWLRYGKQNGKGIPWHCHFRLTFHDPLFLQRSLTAGTVTVVAGNSVDFCIAAFFAITDVVASVSDLQLRIHAATFACCLLTG